MTARRKVEILAEVALLDLLFEVLVRRRDHAHVDVHRLRRSQPLDLALLQHAQHLGLRLQAHVADFVEEDGAAIRLLELAHLPLGGARERSLFVAEQLRLDEVFGNRGAVDLHEALAAPRAQAMNRPRDELLADAALALQQHGRVRRCGLANRLFHLSQGRAVADHLVLRVDFLPKRTVGGLGAMARQLLLDALEQHRLRKRLLDEPGGALVARLEGILRRAVARHHHDGHRGIARP